MLSLIPSWLWAAALSAAMLVNCASQVQLSKQKLVTADLKTQHAELRAAQEQAARQQSEMFRALEITRTNHVAEISAKVSSEQRKTAAAIRAGDSVRSVLIDTTAALATASADGTCDPTTLRRAEDRATAFGRLLGTCDQVAGDLGRASEELASQVRGLQAIYEGLRSSPRPPPPTGAPSED